MQLSTSTNLCAFSGAQGRNPLPFCIETCAAGGYQVLDINLCEAMNPHSRLRGPDWQRYVEELAALGVRCGVSFRQSHLPYYDAFNTDDADKAARMEELIRRAIIASGMLGVKWAVTHPGTLYQAGPDMSLSRARNLEYFSRHLETARAAGVGLALENDFEYRSAPYQHIYCSSPYELVDLVDAFGDDAHIGICYDFGHANLTGGFHRDNLRIIGRRLRATHIHDNRGLADEHMLPFCGNIDWREAMAALAEIDYQGDLTFEAQQFGRFYPNELKPLVVAHSRRVGQALLAYYQQARAEKEAAPPV